MAIGWSAQHNKSTAMLSLFQRVGVSIFKLSVSQAAYIFNVILLPKLELALRYITGPLVNDWIRSYACWSAELSMQSIHR
jgi:hypothetical protein